MPAPATIYSRPWPYNHKLPRASVSRPGPLQEDLHTLSDHLRSTGQPTQAGGRPTCLLDLWRSRSLRRLIVGDQPAHPEAFGICSGARIYSPVAFAPGAGVTLLPMRLLWWRVWHSKPTKTKLAAIGVKSTSTGCHRTSVIGPPVPAMLHPSVPTSAKLH